MSEAKAAKPYPIRIPEGLMELAETKAHTERTDRSTALRQLMYAGAESYVLDLLGNGRISTSRAAEVLGVSVHRVHELSSHRVEIGATEEDYHRSRDETRDLL